MVRRETFIALRARHEAHRIASEIENPPATAVPRPPEPPLPPIDWDPSPRVRIHRSRPATTLRSLAIAFLCAALLYALFIAAVNL
jgi:hypothetical protein